MEWDTSELTLSLKTGLNFGNTHAFLITRKYHGDPVICLNLYYASLISTSRNGIHSQESSLRNLFYIFTWYDAKQMNSLDNFLLGGLTLSTIELSEFSHWMRYRGSRRTRANQCTSSFRDKNGSCQISGKTYSRIILDTGKFLRWCIDFLYSIPQAESLDTPAHIERKYSIKCEISAWVNQVINFIQDSYNHVDDLSDTELIEIDKYLHPNHRKHTSKLVAIRDYVCFRACYEYGIRGGELLALRIDQVPAGNKDYLEVKRVEERENYSDTRTRPPRPKTLSRVLHTIFPDAESSEYYTESDTEDVLYRAHLPYWVNEYLNIRPFSIKHKFLICEHRSGNWQPLASMSMLTRCIRNNTSVKRFNPHVLRHCLFNRLMMSCIDSDSFEQRTIDLQYYGGWKSIESLDIYTKRARLNSIKLISKNIQQEIINRRRSDNV